MFIEIVKRSDIHILEGCLFLKDPIGPLFWTLKIPEGYSDRLSILEPLLFVVTIAVVVPDGVGRTKIFQIILFSDLNFSLCCFERLCSYLVLFPDKVKFVLSQYKLNPKQDHKLRHTSRFIFYFVWYMTQHL